MLKRLVLVTFLGLCLSSVAYAQGRDRECASCDRADARMASVEPSVSEKQRTENELRAAGERYGRAREGRDQAETRAAGKAFRDAYDAYDAVRGGKSAPDDFDFKDQPISREFERMKDWDRRMGGPDRGGPQRDSPGRGRDRDKADNSDRDRGNGRDGGGSPRDTDRDRDTNRGRDNKP